jgi:hypothetical protein
MVNSFNVKCVRRNGRCRESIIPAAFRRSGRPQRPRSRESLIAINKPAWLPLARQHFERRMANLPDITFSASGAAPA